MVIGGQGARLTIANCTCCGSLTREEDEANARFIAAAPVVAQALADLSEAVRRIRDGERNGGAFGMLSIADDAAREALDLAGVKR